MLLICDFPQKWQRSPNRQGLYKVSKKKELSFFLAVTAGVFISIAFVFYITVTTGSAPATALAKLAGGVCFSLGLILVVVCGADLFTSTVLTVMAKASGLISWRQLIINWIIVYLVTLSAPCFLSR
jgi:formate transporter